MVALSHPKFNAIGIVDIKPSLTNPTPGLIEGSPLCIATLRQSLDAGVRALEIARFTPVNGHCRGTSPASDPNVRALLSNNLTAEFAKLA